MIPAPALVRPSCARIPILLPSALTAALALFCANAAHADDASASTPEPATELETIVVNASADASAEGLSKPYAGGQVAEGGRAGILGTHDHLETPFSITSYTNELIQDRQARSVGDVLQNDPTVRTARGFGNFQEAYFIRGFILGSDNVAYNGLYSLLPRQYIATELFERVEVLRGASAFLNGASPGGDALGGSINLLPKRATAAPITRVSAGVGGNLYGTTAVDVGRRFGADQRLGVRLNAAYRDGDSAVDDESAKLGLISLGTDWRGERLRLSADLGYQDNQLDQTRPNVALGAGVTEVPDEPQADGNFAQPWSYSNERDLFGTFRGEVDLGRSTTAWAAYGLRRSEEANSLALFTVSDADSGAATTSRFDNTREDRVDTAELGLRGSFSTGPVVHEVVLAASWFELEKDNAFAFDFAQQPTNLYDPVSSPKPEFSTAGTFFGGDLDHPRLTGRATLTSLALGDSLSLLDDRVLITAGLRHQQLKVAGFDFNTGDKLGETYDEDRVSPLGGVVWRATPALSVYANYVEGLTQGDTRPATALGVPVNNAGEPLDPYVSRQKEFGAKFENGALGLGVALFTTDKPRSLVRLDEGGATASFSSAGRDRHQGIELTAYGAPLRGLRVLGGATWIDAEQRKTGDATEGNRVIGVPRFQANAGLEWDVRGVQGLAVDGRIVHTGDSYADGANQAEADGWSRLDLGTRYLFGMQDHVVTLRLRVDNVTDEDYWDSSGGFPGSGYLVLGAPRSFVFSASVDL